MAAFPFMLSLGPQQRSAEMPGNIEMAPSCSSDLPKVEGEILASGESELRMMDDSKQSHSVAFLRGKRTNICQR